MNALKKFPRSLYGAMLAALLLMLTHEAWAGDWNFRDSDGVHLSLSGLHGKWVLVNFWAPWCPPCIREMPELVALQRHNKELQVIGVAVMYDSRKEVTDVIAKQSLSYPIVFGNEDTAGDFGGLNGLPTSFLYSPAGELIGRIQGPINRADIERKIR